MKRATNELVLTMACLAAVPGCDQDILKPTKSTPVVARSALTPAGVGETSLDIVNVVASSHRANKVPEKTLDGKLETRWQAWGKGQSIRYDLGATRGITKVKIAWYRGNGRTSSFDIQTSIDGKTWTPLFSGESSGETAALESYDVRDIGARYVQIVGHGTTESAENLIAEVEIWGDQSAQAKEEPLPSTSNTLAITEVRASAHEGNNVARNVLDGDLETYWKARGDSQWIGFDLGRVRHVGSVEIAWVNGTHRVAKFDVSTATDLGSWDWTRVFSGESSGKSEGLEAYDITDVDARYVLVMAHGTTMGPDNMIAEVAILGEETSKEVTPPPSDGGDTPPPANGGNAPPSPSNGTLFSDGFDGYAVNARPQGHIANGFSWAPGSPGIEVSDDYAYSGTKSLRFAYPGKPDPAAMGSKEKRFVLAPEGTTSIDEIWIEFMIRVPDNWEHRQSAAADNNKLLVLWAEDYASTRTEAAFGFEWGRASNTVSSLDIASGRGDDPRPVRQLQAREGVHGIVFDASMRGEWIRLRFHVKISVLGIIRAWRDNELIADMPFPYNTAILGGGRNYLRHGYLMGWSNSGFTQDTNFYIDDFKIWTTDPHWTFN